MSLLSIPSELLPLILSTLDIKSFAIASQTCKALYEAGWKNEICWRSIALRNDIHAPADFTSWKNVAIFGLSLHFQPRDLVELPGARECIFTTDKSVTIFLLPLLKRGCWRANFRPAVSGAVRVSTDMAIGISAIPDFPGTYLGNDEHSLDWNADGNVYGSAVTHRSKVPHWGADDTVGMEIDMDRHTVCFLKNEEPVGSCFFPASWTEIRLGVCGRSKGLRFEALSLRPIKEPLPVSENPANPDTDRSDREDDPPSD